MLNMSKTAPIAFLTALSCFGGIMTLWANGGKVSR